MLVNLTIDGERVCADLARPLDVSVRMRFDGAPPEAFGLPGASAAPYVSGGFIASVAGGAGFNCDVVQLAPHGNGTHTECVGHITRAPEALVDHLDGAMLPCCLLTVALEPIGDSGEGYPVSVAPDELVITAAALARAFGALGAPSAAWTRALAVRARPAHADAPRVVYSGKNPPYLTEEAMRWVRARGVQHLLVELPSVDREQDGGALPNHHIFWSLPPGAHVASDASRGRTITELMYAPDLLLDGRYLLSLQAPPFALDAAPSRPILYAIAPCP